MKRKGRREAIKYTLCSKPKVNRAMRILDYWVVYGKVSICIFIYE